MTTEELAEHVITHLIERNESTYYPYDRIDAARDGHYIITEWMHDFPGDPNALAGVIDLRDALKKIAQ